MKFKLQEESSVAEKARKSFQSYVTPHSVDKMEFKRSEVINNQVKNIRHAMEELRDYLDKWHSKNIARKYAMAADISGFDDKAFLQFYNSLVLSGEDIDDLEKFRTESVNEANETVHEGAVKLRNLKKGDYFTRKPIEYPKESQVFIKDDYDRETKKFLAIKFNDAGGNGILLSGDTIVYTDFFF